VNELLTQDTSRSAQAARPPYRNCVACKDIGTYRKDGQSEGSSSLSALMQG
jgi:hypothetical protein